MFRTLTRSYTGSISHFESDAMSFSLNKLRSYLPGQNSSSNKQRHSVSLEPEIGFQIFIESAPSVTDNAENVGKLVPELNVVLIAARHLPTVFGFKMVQGYNIKVKLFPGSKRFDSSIQTNSWPKFNESFRFPLAPDIKPSLKSYTKGKSKPEFLPEEIFTGHFVVFTVYALLELPPASFNRFNKTYRSLKERSTSLVQKVVDSGAKTKDDETLVKAKSKNSKPDDIPQLTTSESKRNIGSVTCYLEPKVFKRNSRTGQFCTDELWLPIKDINSTVLKGTSNLASSTKGVIEIILELQDAVKEDTNDSEAASSNQAIAPNGNKRQWAALTEVKRRIGMNNPKTDKALTLKVTTSRMRCSNKVKDELENSAGYVYVKTTVFEHNIYSDSWKSNAFFPSLSTKWSNETSTVVIALKQCEDFKHILIKTTLATKTKIGKKIVLGTVIIGPSAIGSGLQHWQDVDGTRNDRIPMWHSFQ